MSGSLHARNKSSNTSNATRGTKYSEQAGVKQSTHVPLSVTAAVKLV